MENTAWVLFHKDDVSGVYTSYRQAIHALMMRAALPIYNFSSELGVDCYQDGNNSSWMIEEFELDKI